jgi:hypothetical protein
MADWQKNKNWPWNQIGIGDPGALEVPDSIGGPWRTRTSDPLIKRRTGGLSLSIPIHQISALYAIRGGRRIRKNPAESPENRQRGVSKVLSFSGH